jgi:transcriptional regulator with XRE-family HTH domain
MDKKMKLTDAVKALRSALGDTQHAFANRMKTAIRTVARWETIRPPSGVSLAQLEGLAATNGLEDLAAVFRAAIADELGSWDTSEFKSIGIAPRTESEKLWVAAVLITLRNSEFVKNRVKLISSLREPAKACIRIVERHHSANRVTREADRLLDMGVEPGVIANDLKVPEEDIRNRAAVRNMARIVQEGINWAKEHGSEKSK